MNKREQRETAIDRDKTDMYKERKRDWDRQ